jgi:hypothetical protein
MDEKLAFILLYKNLIPLEEVQVALVAKQAA